MNGAHGEGNGESSPSEHVGQSFVGRAFSWGEPGTKDKGRMAAARRRERHVGRPAKLAPEQLVYARRMIVEGKARRKSPGRSVSIPRRYRGCSRRGEQENIMWTELVKAAAELVKAMAWPIAVVIVTRSFKPGLLSALPSLFRRKFELEGLGFKAKIDAAEQQQPAPENLATER